METSLAGAPALTARIDRLALSLGSQVAQNFVSDADPEGAAHATTFAAFGDDVRRRARALASIDVRADTPISFMAPLSATGYATLGAVASVAMLAPVNYFLEYEALLELIVAARSTVLLTARQFPDEPNAVTKIGRIRAALPHLRHIVFGEGDAFADAFDLEAFADGEPARTWPAVAGRDDPARIATILHTGGTTGGAKLVPLSQAMLLAAVESCGEAMGTSAGDVMLSALPLFHTSGTLQAGLVPLLNGAQLMIPSAKGFRDPNVTRNYWRFVERYGVTLTPMLPTVLAALCAIPRDRAIPSLKRFICGGAPLAAATIDALASLTGGVPIVEGWGMTETCGFSTFNPLTGGKGGSAGRPMRGIEIEVRSIGANGTETVCEADVIGELVVRGTFAIARYYSERTASFTRDGWLRTGDLARVDTDGFIWITGRVKDLIIRGGHNIDPASIESVAYQHTAVQLAAAVGRPDPYAGELPMLYLQLKTGAVADAAEIRNFVAERVLERASAPKVVRILDELPQTGPGKISKLLLRREAIREVFREELERLGEPRTREIDIRVEDDPLAGTVAVLIAPDSGLSSDLERAIEAALRRYPIEHRWVRVPVAIVR